MSGILDSMKSAFTSSSEAEGDDESDTKSFFSNAREQLGLPKLSLKQRAIGFGICIGIAAIFALLGCILSIVSLATFGVLFTVSTIAGLISTFFLVGPIDQLKKMCDPKNVTAMIVKIVCFITLILMFVLAMCAVFWWHIPLLSILFCIVEFVALAIYAITLIPFATTLINRGVRSAMSD